MKKYIKPLIGFVFGAIAGYLYYTFVGCKTGSCPITSNPYISTIYGGVLGLLLIDVLFGLFKPKKTA